MRFLVSIHHADDYDAVASEDAATIQAIDDLNDEMEAAGVRKFAGGLHRAMHAKSITADGVTDGPYLKTEEHVGGFWMLECADMDEAVEWGKKATAACRAPVEVRQFHG